MWLTKDGITLDIQHPADIAKYKRLGYVEFKPKPAEEPKAETFAEEQQRVVEEAIQPKKKGKGEK